MAGYAQTLAEDVEVQDLLVELWSNRIAPYYYEHGALYGSAVGPIIEGEREPMVQARQFRPDVAAFVENRLYSNLLSARVLRLGDVTSRHDEAVREIDVLLRLLEGH